MPEQRYHLRAYVCEGGNVRWTSVEGYMTFGQIFRDRPYGCRYAVAESGNRYVTMDLFAAEVTRTFDVSLGQRGQRAFDDLDAAIMSCVLTHDMQK